MEDIGIGLHDLMKVVRRLKQHRAAEHPVIPSGMLGVLAEIDRLPTGCLARDLATRSGLDASTVSRAVSALVKEGLVRRRADEHDGRATRLLVTEAGQEALRDSMDWYGRVIAESLGSWSPAEIEAFSRSLERFTTSVEETLDRHG
ncbi:MAG TPA: MarR family winged helix-turn-helix transcriptional regulator [Actinoplanes sp.]|nr:MarR family winged helix-turn-helix transcriptional regulator [Actinoplanes sp.]